MRTKKVEIEGQALTLGEAKYGALEDYQDGLESATTAKERTAASRRFICHCLERGGHAITPEQLRDLVTASELVLLDEEAIAISGARRRSEGEATGP